MANHGRAFGMSADLQKKAQAKYDPKLEAEAKSWLEALVGVSIGPSVPEGLKDGVILCRAMNVLQPGAIPKINDSKMPFKQMENIGNFLRAASAYGVLETDLFQTVDLYEAKNMIQVIDGVHALSRVSQRKGFRGPAIGPKESESNPRHFDEAKLRASEAIIPSQAGYVGGATQSGMNFGLARQIKS